MLEQTAEALNRRDYSTAAKLITTLIATQPENPQVQLYSAQLQEATSLHDEALDIYRSLLRSPIANRKILTEARLGTQRIEELQAKIQANALICARAGIEDNLAPGFLIIEPITLAQKQIVAPRFAAIMNIDIYTAKLQLPSRAWRLYRLGTMGELEFYRDQLLQAEIPCFCVSQRATEEVSIFNANYFKSFYPQPEIVCTDDRSSLRTFKFNWSEVTQIVMGLLPIFEEVMEMDAYNRTQRKPKTLDYVHICDIHFRSRQTVLRLCSQTYDFCDYKQLFTQNRHQVSQPHQGDLAGRLNGELIPVTSRDNWKNLMAQIQEQVPEIKTRTEFTPFAETAIAYREMLPRINPHIELLRRENSLWDQAFHLYSMLSMNHYLE